MMVMGVSYNEFWKLTPRQVKVIAEGYKLKHQVDDEQAWIVGGYVFEAVSLALGNSFRKKFKEPKDYYKDTKPVSKRVEDLPDENGLTEEYKKEKTELLFKNLEIMAANYRLNNGK